MRSCSSHGKDCVLYWLRAVSKFGSLTEWERLSELSHAPDWSFVRCFFSNVFVSEALFCCILPLQVIFGVFSYVMSCITRGICTNYPLASTWTPNSQSCTKLDKLKNALCIFCLWVPCLDQYFVYQFCIQASSKSMSVFVFIVQSVYFCLIFILC